MGRVLGRVRLSRETEASTSEERQREIIEAWAAAHGHEVMGWATDLGTSGSVSPFKAPELGPWLQPDRLPEWDILCAWKLDRLARDAINMNELFKFCRDRDKALVSVSESLDLSTWVGRMVAGVIAGVAEGELEAIQERTRGSQQKLRETGRWHGGTVPYGYRSEKTDDGGHRLVIEPEEATVIREMVTQVLEGRSSSAVAAGFNERGIFTRKEKPWKVQVVLRMLRSRLIIGQAEHDRNWKGHKHSGEGRKLSPVLDSDGIPLQRAEPIISFDQWTELQAVLEDRERPRTRKNTTGMLLNVARCVCGQPLYQHATVTRGKPYRYWKCRLKGRRDGCRLPAIPAEYLELAVEERLLYEVGDLERQERVFVPGESYAEDLAKVRDAIARLHRESDLGLVDDEDEYMGRLTDLVNRRKRLEAMPSKPSGWEWHGLGETYGQAWKRMDALERRSLLTDSGISFTAQLEPWYLDMYVPPEVMEQRFPGWREQQERRDADAAETRKSLGVD